MVGKHIPEIRKYFTRGKRAFFIRYRTQQELLGHLTGDAEDVAVEVQAMTWSELEQYIRRKKPIMSADSWETIRTTKIKGGSSSAFLTIICTADCHGFHAMACMGLNKEQRDVLPPPAEPKPTAPIRKNLYLLKTIDKHLSTPDVPVKLATDNKNWILTASKSGARVFFFWYPTHKDLLDYLEGERKALPDNVRLEAITWDQLKAHKEFHFTPDNHRVIKQTQDIPKGCLIIIATEGMTAFHTVTGLDLGRFEQDDEVEKMEKIVQTCAQQ